jgi:hypothetical protein
VQSPFLDIFACKDAIEMFQANTDEGSLESHGVSYCGVTESLFPMIVAHKNVDVCVLNELEKAVPIRDDTPITPHFCAGFGTMLTFVAKLMLRVCSIVVLFHVVEGIAPIFIHWSK